jgi:hypothetical protein
MPSTSRRPGEHVFDDRIGDLAFSLEHFEHLIAKEVFQVFWFRARRYLEYAVIGKATIRGDRVQMGVEILEFTESLDGYRGAGSGTVIGDRLFQVNAQYFPGTAREPGKQLSVVHEVDSQALGDAEHPLPVGNGFEHFGA